MQEVKADRLPCQEHSPPSALHELQVQHSWAADGVYDRQGFFRYLQHTEVFRHCSEHTEKQNIVMPNTAGECIYAAVRPFPLLRQCVGETLTPLNDDISAALGCNKSVVILVELLLGKPSNM